MYFVVKSVILNKLPNKKLLYTYMFVRNNAQNTKYIFFFLLESSVRFNELLNIFRFCIILRIKESNVYNNR